MQFVTAPSYLDKKVVGFLYTEDDHPYSNKFRPSVPANLTVNIQMRVGEVAATPSSTYLFYEWFGIKFGHSPTYRTVIVWAAFDFLEKALYTAAIQPKMLKETFISPVDCFALLRLGHCSTPYGMVAFDANRINSGWVISVVFIIFILITCGLHFFCGEYYFVIHIL